ncbi:hypothetical protein SCLCIDRAFT_969796 [Scleroderma citrinum Foug A]|uniref:Uncharacterized protein n=1 Tax=Scleroderma citrinum Foug A TaxID=1036808 RepID=A0A0C3DHE3_9AGAM|nr:hypothetical protein SCLCIDRAFT_969796 [Scleroderma citrinum Foug A]
MNREHGDTVEQQLLMRLGSICNHRGRFSGGTHSLFSFYGQNAIFQPVIWAVRRFFGDSFLVSLHWTLDQVGAMPTLVPLS